LANAPTLYDFEIDYSDGDRGISERLRLRTARHPSETLERVWLRVLAYCWKYEERLTFGPGLSDTEAPDLLATDLTGQVTRWIRVGKASAEKIQKVIDRNQAAQISVLFESQLRLDQFRQEAAEGTFPRLHRAELAAVEPELLTALAAEDTRRHKLQLTLVGDRFYIGVEDQTLEGGLILGRIDSVART
jgi:uncharacterized protein YaeQ